MCAGCFWSNWPPWYDWFARSSWRWWRSRSNWQRRTCGRPWRGGGSWRERTGRTSWTTCMCSIHIEAVAASTVGSHDVNCWVTWCQLLGHVMSTVGSCDVNCWVTWCQLLGHVISTVGSCDINCWFDSYVSTFSRVRVVSPVFLEHLVPSGQ